MTCCVSYRHRPGTRSFPMNTLPQVAGTLQSLFESEAEEIGRRVGLIRRLRKFSAAILLKMLMFTVLKTPRPKTKDYASTAAQLGATVTERAAEQRFAAVLVAFLRAVLECLLQKLVAMPPVAIPLLKKFTAVYIGDSTTIPLPDDCADEFPGCGGKAGSGKAALKIQALWEL